MGKFPVHPIIWKVQLYYALLRVVSMQWGVSLSVQLIGTIVKVMTFIEQFISWAASEINGEFNSNKHPTVEIKCLDL